MKDLLLKNGEIVNSLGVFRQDVLISNGKIVSVGENISGDFEEIDCEGKIILPGLIDAHVHFREPGSSHKEDWTTGSMAAASGGVTTVFDMPNNSPAITTVERLNEKRKLIDGRTYINYGLFIGFDGDNVDEINKAKNIPGVKFYATHSTGDMGVNHGVEELFEHSNKLIVVHAEDEDIIKENTKKYVGDRTKIDMANHSKIRSAEAAKKSVQDLCKLVKETGHRMHVAHLSTEAELEIVEKYREYGVTCEVAPHHLLLSDEDYADKGALVKMNPPVRSRMDLFGLWKGIKFGQVDIIATDHAPHTLGEKKHEYCDCPSGVPEVETTLPILLNVVNDEGLSLEEVVKLCCERPAEIFGVQNKGKIEEGYDADLVVVDMDLEKKVENKNLFTKCGWSPYDGMSFKGWPVMTFVHGELVFKEGEFVGGKVGKEVEFR
jgi:dihydroorotase